MCMYDAAAAAASVAAGALSFTEISNWIKK